MTEINKIKYIHGHILGSSAAIWNITSSPLPHCYPEIGFHHNYGLPSILEPLGGDGAGGNGGRGGAPRSPAEVHLWWASGSGQSGQSYRQPTQAAQAQKVRGAEEHPGKIWLTYSYLTTANEDPDLDSERERQPIRGWERKAGGSGGRSCESGVFFTVRWLLNRNGWCAVDYYTPQIWQQRNFNAINIVLCDNWIFVFVFFK